jgi:hypothetical protein
MRIALLLCSIVALAPGLAAGCGDSDPQGNGNQDAGNDNANDNANANANDNGNVDPHAAYAGSDACATCHPTEHADHLAMGHPWIMRAIEGAAPTYSATGLHVHVPAAPDGYSWSIVPWVVGGYAWMARFVDASGYLVTGNEVEYDVSLQVWHDYDQGTAAGTKAFDCGGCHTVGWIAATGQGSPRQGDLPGMGGYWYEPGVGCEACHGPGAAHVASQSPADILLDRSAEVCSACHSRGLAGRIEAKNGFIRHHAQYDEFLAVHARDNITCVDCHRPHSGVKVDPAQGIRLACETCHTPVTYTRHGPEATCVDCHMPRTGKSSYAINEYVGDLRSHVFSLDASAVGKDTLFYTEGDLELSLPKVTLDFACYGCHRDPLGVGGTGTVQTLQQLSDFAVGMHVAP